jgi:hypothetical protein
MASTNSTAPTPAPTTQELLEARGPAVGDVAPGFSVNRIDGRQFILSQYARRVVVIEFGSLSCPSFRDRAPGMEALRRKFGRRAEFLIIYTREAHPVGGWEVRRNKEEGIRIEAAADDDGRRVLARQAADALKIKMPVAVDTMDDSVARAYGGFPNAVVVIGRDGRIAARQQWTDPTSLGRVIAEAAAQPAPPATRENAP